jgi:hypothetical protein
MAILGLDGNTFKLKSSLQQFDPANPDQNLFNQYDAELIRMSGSPLYYYEVLIQIQTIDQIYMEDRGKLWSPNPITIYGLYEPQKQTATSGLFGMDTPDEEVIFECNSREIITLLGHLPVRGSRIFTPHLQENWVVIDVKLDQFKLWGALHVLIHCQKFQATSTDASANIEPTKTDLPEGFPVFN